MASKISITNSRIDGKVDFRDIITKERVDIGSQLNRDANFSGSQFYNDVHFNGSFNGPAFFTDSLFNRSAIFIDCKFNSDAFFDNSRFTVIAFIKSQFNNDAFFGGARLGLLQLSFTKYDKLHIRWNNIGKLVYDDMTYLLLIENFKKLGFFEDADNCYYSYRIERRRNLPTLYKLADWILMNLYGYGVKPLRPLAGLVIVLIAFGLLYSYYEIAGNTLGDAFNTSSTVLLSGSQLIGTPAYPTSGILPYWIFTFEKLLGSLFFGMFLISIGRTIIR